MSFSIDVLENIKTIYESEADEDPNFLEGVLNDFPVVAQIESPKNDGDEVEDEIEIGADPLEESFEDSTAKDFLGEYNEVDYLNADEDDEPLKNFLIELVEEKRPKKRARISTDFKGRNGHVWSTVRPTTEIPDDVPTQIHQPKGKGPAGTVSNPLEAWHLLIDERIQMQILKQTNEQIKKRKSKLPHQRITDAVELRAWYGLNYLCGLFRNSAYNGPLEELWTLELGNAIFRATMSVKRFEFLADCIRFCEPPTGKKRKTGMEVVLQMWEKFLINCRSYYTPSGNCTIDEHILSTTDAKCPFSLSLPHNPMESGIRLVTLCDAKTLYMSNAVVAIDETPSEPEVLHLICDIKGTNRNVTLTERYTSMQLANKLKQCELTVVGVLPATAKEIPSDMVQAKTQRKLYAGDATLTSGVRTAEGSAGFMLTNGISQKVNASKLYDLTHPCCQRFQQLASIYSTSFSTPVAHYTWSLHFFHNILNYAALNSWILFRLSAKGESNILQRDFMRQLGLYLTQQQLKRRLQSKDKLSIAQRLQICEILGESNEKLLSNATSVATKAVSAGTIQAETSQLPEGVHLLPKIMEKRQRCRKCRGANCPKTRSRCQQCLRALCHRHLITRCDDCTGVQPLPEPEKEDDENGVV